MTEECKKMPSFQVDFNASDDDGAVRLGGGSERQAIDGTIVPMCEGQEAYITDDEMAAIGQITLRDGIWVVVVSRWLGDVTSPRLE